MPSPSRELWVSAECKWVWGKRDEGCFLLFHQMFAGMTVNMPLLPAQSSHVHLIYSDAEIFPGPEEQHAIDVPCRQELVCQALHLPGWSAQRTAENLPSLEGRTLLCFVHAAIMLFVRFSDASQLFSLFSCHLSNMESGFLVYNLALKK